MDEEPERSSRIGTTREIKDREVDRFTRQASTGQMAISMLDLDRRYFGWRHRAELSATGSRRTSYKSVSVHNLAAVS